MRRSDVQFKAKAEVASSALFDGDPELETVEEVKVVPAAMIPKGWEPLPEHSVNYPYDGQPVWLTDDGVNAYPATWRVTRAYDSKNVKWVYDAYWARHNAGGQRIEFIPVGYKRMED